jgi:thiamine biosynthesis lipoprotein
MWLVPNAILAPSARAGLRLVHALAFIVPSFTVAANPTPVQQTLHGTTMGSTYAITYVAVPDRPSVAALQREIDTALETLNDQMSTYRASSELSRLNASPDTGWRPLSAPLYTVLDTALTVSRATKGAFDVTVGPLVNLWGFGPENRAPEIPPSTAIDAARARVGYRMLTLRATPRAVRRARGDLAIDLSALVPGYAADIVGELLERRGIMRYMVDIGGEVKARGTRADGSVWQIGIEYPDPSGTRIAQVVALDGAGLATSGDYRNFFELDGQRYSHEIDPATGWPVAHGLVEVSVVAARAIDADAYATGLLVLGPVKGPRLADELGLAALFFVRQGEAINVIPSRAFVERFRPPQPAPPRP